MFAKSNRASKKDIDEIFKDGSFINSPNLTFKFLLKKEISVKRISFIAPKSVSKRAVTRNKLRRLGYQILKNYMSFLPDGATGVFIFSKNSLVFLKKPKKEAISKLEEEILSILKKLSKTNPK